jgi:hypothetical protein
VQPAPKPKPTPPPREGGASKRAGGLGPILRVGLSIFLVWHFTGVFLAALSIPYSSGLVMRVAQKWPMQWYLDALYLNQGHSFFAPEVGPGHVIYYELFDQSNQRIADGTLPDKKEYWPRLRYHRHFMLADQAELPAGPGQDEHFWERKYLDAYALHLLRENPAAQTVRVRRFSHWPLPGEFATRGIQPIKDQVRQMREQAENMGPEQRADVERQAQQLARSATREGLKRGYAMFRPIFERETGGRKIDEEGYEVTQEVTKGRRDLGPEAADQSLLWNNQSQETARRWNRGLR